MDSFQYQHEKSFNLPPIMNPPPQIFGDPNGSPLTQDFTGGQFFADELVGSLDESSEAKRRRIARV